MSIKYVSGKSTRSWCTKWYSALLLATNILHSVVLVIQAISVKYDTETNSIHEKLCIFIGIFIMYINWMGKVRAGCLDHTSDISSGGAVVFPTQAETAVVGIHYFCCLFAKIFWSLIAR